MNSQKLYIKIILLVFIPLVVGLAVFVMMHLLFVQPVNRANKSKVVVEVKGDTSLTELGNMLVEKKLIKSPYVLSTIIKFIKKDNKEIKEGEYELSPSMKPREIADKLLSGQIVIRKITIEPGSSIWDVGKLLLSAGVISSEDVFNEKLIDEDLLKSYSLDSFEGYFAPVTYKLSRLDPPERIIARMVKAADKRWKEKYTEKAEELDLSRHEVLTIASILEKEVEDPEIYPDFASVLYNRHTFGMPLQSDATVAYKLAEVRDDYDGVFLPEYRSDDHPYNTWTNPGLPPGPICNPSKQAIEAVLNMPKNSNIYWGKDSKGEYHFASGKKELEDLLTKANAEEDEEKLE